MSDSVRPHRWQPTRLPHPWDFPGKNTGVGCHFLLQCMKVKSESEVAQSCPTLSDPMDCSLPGSSFPGIFQAGVLEWGAIAFSYIVTSSLLMKERNVYFSQSYLNTAGKKINVKKKATHSSILAWRIPGMGEPGGLPSMGWHRVRHD